MTTNEPWHRWWHESCFVWLQPESDGPPMIGSPIATAPAWSDEPFPEWVSRFRGHQWVAARQIVDAFADGRRVVVLDAPTGSGKTLIAEMVRRMLGVRGLYVASDKGLQDQFATDFPCAVLKGRANYPSQTAGVGCDACNKRVVGDVVKCAWCPHPNACAYQVAKVEALTAKLAVVNTAYLLTETNGPGRFSNRKFIVVDEADVLERGLMGHVELNVSERRLAELGLEAPAKGVHMTTLVKWCSGTLLPAVVDRMDATREDTVENIRRKNVWRRLAGDIETATREIAASLEDTGPQRWIRDNDAGPLVLKPITVAALGKEYLWQHSERWLVMSATVISAEEMMGSLGVPRDDWELVRVPMTFPVENRPIHVVPVADMGAKVNERDELVAALVKVCTDHDGERVLIHAVSYDLTRHVVRELSRLTARRVMSYDRAGDREKVVAEFRTRANAVLVAPSLERGVDLAGDACRVVVIAKVPFPYLGDKQVSARAYAGNAGRMWYAVQTIRSIVQMTGRGVRSETDWAVSYIFDKQFLRLWRENKLLFPSWWRDAVNMNVDVKRFSTNNQGAR